MFLELLQKDNSVTIRQWKLQVLVTDIFKAKYDLSPEIMTEVFELQESSYSLDNKEITLYAEILKLPTMALTK